MSHENASLPVHPSSKKGIKGRSLFRLLNRKHFKRVVRIMVKCLLAFLIALCIAFLFHNKIFDAVGSFMAIHDPIEKSDLILVINHEAQTIPFAADDLYRKGYAPLIVLGSYRARRIEQLGIV